MLIPRFHKLLTAKAATTTRLSLGFWFSLSLTFTAIYGSQVLLKAFSSEYVVQEDARVYVFWMQRFVDPDLLPHDFITEYFKSVTPIGYAALFQLMTSLGIGPLLLSKLLPIVLGLSATAYGFGICLQILPVPYAGFIAMLLMNQSLWLKDDLTSATPRGFLYPLFLAFLYYLLRRSLLPVVVAIALMGLFYPPIMFISVGILIVRLWRWEKGQRGTEAEEKKKNLRLSSPHLSIAPNAYFVGSPSSPSPLLLCAAGLGIALLVMLPYALSSSEFGSPVTAAQARTWPEFSANGRIPFFTNNPWRYWLQGGHSGIRLSLNPPLVSAGLLLPFLLRYPSRFPLAKLVTKNVILLAQIVLVSLGLFFAAHAVLFKLYLPSRYTVHSLLIVMALAGGVALSIMLDAAFQWVRQHQRQRKQHFLALGATVLVGVTLFFYPSLFWKNAFPRTFSYIVGGQPELYKFFQQQPKNILIASLTDETNNLPTFSRRSILVARKYADPYIVGYYRKIRQRAIDLIRAQYSPNLAEAQSFIQKYGVDFWLVERTTFTAGYLDNRWLKQFQPATDEALARLKAGIVPALAKEMNNCSVFQRRDFVVLQAKCIAQAANATEDQSNLSREILIKTL